MSFDMSMLDPWKEPSRWSGAGVVPICTPVLHTPTTVIDRVDGEIRKLAEHMLTLMRERSGIGLAANQAGAPVRMFVHGINDAAPSVIINPIILSTQGSWTYREGCLSVQIPGSAAPVVRPKKITIRGLLLDGRKVKITANELLARVFQHEIDHLDGIEYVQRLTGPERERVYALLAADGVDNTWVPSKPYLGRLGSASTRDVRQPMSEPAVGVAPSAPPASFRPS
jgi:peptide deformylase